MEGEKNGYVCCCCFDSIYKGMGLGLKEMPPLGARRSSQGQRSNDEEGWRTVSRTMALLPCHKWMLLVLIEAQRAIYIEETPNPKH